jgi:uncharacterized pyridoxal phosphate-containing UPF0001 family protein
VTPESVRAAYDRLRREAGDRAIASDPEASRSWFHDLRELADRHGLTELSMGTSQDWRVAVEEGATLIRVGSTLFRD